MRDLLPWLLIVAVLWVIFYLRLRRGRPADRSLAARRDATLHRIESRPSVRVLILCAVTMLLLALALDAAPRWRSLAGAIAAVTILLEFFVLRPRRRRRFRERLVRENYLICPDCLYSLAGLPDPGRCPECGRPFARAHLADEWNEILSFQVLGRRE